MLLDGTVLVAGSNPNDTPVDYDKVDPNNQYTAFPTEYRIEIWTPPYLIGKDHMRPTHITLSRRTFVPGVVFNVKFRPVKDPRSVDIVLYHGGFVTHALHMGQKMVFLPNQGWEEIGGGFKRVIASIPRLALAPGPYVLYAVVDGVPSIGQSVLIET